MAEWLYEAGIGENRAIRVEDGRIVEAQIERPGLRAGTVIDGRLAPILVPRRRGIATLADGTEVLVEPLSRATEGAVVRLEIVREAIPEPGAIKRAKARVTDAALCDGPDLAERIGAHRAVGAHDDDLFEAAGWSECLEDADRLMVGFPHGQLRISLTPAMTLIDVDGILEPGALAIAGADAAARVIRCFGLAGNIGIDFPTVSGRDTRLAIATAFDARLPKPYERTTVNGFGFLQIIRPRLRASLCETLTNDRTVSRALALIRQTQRSGAKGATEIVASAPVAAAIRANPDWIDALSRALGGVVTINIR